MRHQFYLFIYLLPQGNKAWRESSTGSSSEIAQCSVQCVLLHSKQCCWHLQQLNKSTDLREKRQQACQKTRMAKCSGWLFFFFLKVYLFTLNRVDFKMATLNQNKCRKLQLVLIHTAAWRSRSYEKKQHLHLSQCFRKNSTDKNKLESWHVGISPTINHCIQPYQSAKSGAKWRKWKNDNYMHVAMINEMQFCLEELTLVESNAVWANLTKMEFSPEFTKKLLTNLNQT